MTTTTTTWQSRRRGYAPLELVLSLPILVILAGMIFTIAAAAVTRGNVAIQARNDAWQTVKDKPSGQLLWWSTTPGSGNPFVPPNPDATKGTVHKTSSAVLRTYAGRFFPFGKTASAEHSVLHGSWDYTAIPIVTNAPLLPSQQLQDFVANDLNFLLNWSNLQYLLKNLKVGNLSIQDLLDAVDLVKKTWSDLGDLEDAFSFPPNLPKLGRSFGRLIDDGVNLAAVAQKLSGSMDGNNVNQPDKKGTPSPLDILKALKNLPDAISDLRKALSGIGDIIGRLMKSNDY